ncbi:HD domain-containing protein [Lutibacter sp. HS1-25]|uniref:HD domain-containing protein n=1 Tax=Lutibacter sp. HS1-25 TaxID=2485000 RepID=UPI001010F7E4|nr:HD domain-containing protein [Lutibacter sp. HS1-25]RXP61336.1 HD domain-containing protein [Lutibacter sp. HS1-25]
MNKKQIIYNTENFVKTSLKNAEGGHDWFHILRVWNNAKLIANSEKVDLFIVELGALLHDIADSKFHNGDESIGPKVARNFLESEQVDESVIVHIENIISNISYKGGNFEQKFTSPELDVIQDADRLDAIGAIGIARCFNYGGFKNRSLYDPEIPPKLNQTKEEYKNATAPTINHFYEKLLLLKDKMNTQTGKEIAKERHQFMENFLKQFYGEWEGSK